MIPDLPNLSSFTTYGRFIQPYNRLKMPLEDYARGGVQLNDASQGLDVKNWYIELRNGVCKISAAGSPDFIVTNVPAQSTWVSFTFDQNMHHNLAYIYNNDGYFYWYDAASNSYVTTNFGKIRTPIVRLDDVRDFSLGTSDIILSYIKDGNLCVRVQSDRFSIEYVLARNVGNRLFQCGMNNQLRFQWQIGAMYPESLPCPQADTDLVPRERRYLSEIGDVRNLRMFQQEFQATRNKIHFIFTEEEAAEFRDWYENGIFNGGAWFYANWPLLHTDKLVAHRFVGQPKWEWIYGGNPGKLGRSKQGGGFALPDDAVTVYKVSATVEVYDRKVENFYKTKIYPLFFHDSITLRGITARGLPFATINDSVSLFGKSITSGSVEKYIYSSYLFDDSIALQGKIITAGSTGDPFIYSKYTMADEAISLYGKTITSGEIQRSGYIDYDYFIDNISMHGLTITSGEIE